jgi:glycosyltransferase involved in cell wall biosynthesis
MKPVLFVTGHVAPERVGAFASLHERENVQFALFGGPSKHGGSLITGDLPFPHLHVRQHELARLAASANYRAVVCSTGGRVALPGTWMGARQARLPLVLWSSLWAHPRSAAHALSYVALSRLYRSADAVVTYGSHVSAYVKARGARNIHIAPQSVDNEFWSKTPTPKPQDPAWPKDSQVKFLFVGRPAREKGLRVLFSAWRASGLSAPSAALVLVGVGSCPPWVPAGGAAESTANKVICIDAVSPEDLRNFYGDADVLVLPSIPTATFREPWGLVINEAMNQQLPVIASNAVGAVAGGLVRDGHNGLVVPAGNAGALAKAMRRLGEDRALRARLGQTGASDIGAFSHDAWAQGFSSALASLGLSRERW